MTKTSKKSRPHNLLPAGTSPVSAFCQIYSLKYRQQMQTSEICGLYTIKFTLWSYVSAQPLGSNSADFEYKVRNGDKGTVPVTVALPPLTLKPN